MGSKSRKNLTRVMTANSKFLMPYGPDEGVELSEIMRVRLEWLSDSLPRCERWMKRRIQMELKRRDRVAFEVRRAHISATLLELEGKQAIHKQPPVKQCPDELETYAGTMSAWGVPHPECWDDMSDEGRRRWNEQQSKLWMKRPLGSR
jgi:hypothetical protein